jgi:hypothetical protein
MMRCVSLQVNLCIVVHYKHAETNKTSKIKLQITTTLIITKTMSHLAEGGVGFHCRRERRFEKARRAVCGRRSEGERERMIV